MDIRCLYLYLRTGRSVTKETATLSAITSSFILQLARRPTARLPAAINRFPAMFFMRGLRSSRDGEWQWPTRASDRAQPARADIYSRW